MIAALVLRVHALSLTAFNIDEAILSLYANQLAHLKSFPLEGIKTSFGFSNPPLMIYLTAPFFRLTPDPRFAMFGFAMAGAAAVGLAGLAGSRLWGNWSGIATAVIVTFSPNAIEHSRRLWGHDTMLFWSALVIYAAIRGIQTERKRWLWLSLAGAAGAQACHLSGVILWIVPVGALLLFRPPHWKKSLAIGAAVLGLIYLPWLINDASEHFENLKLMVLVATGQSDVEVRPSQVPAVLSWLTIMADGQHNDLFGHAYSEFLFSRPWFAIFVAAAQGLLTSLLLAGLASLVFVIRRMRQTQPEDTYWAGLLLAQAATPVVIFTLLPVESVPPYQLPALVPVAMAAGFFLSRSGAFFAGLRRRAESHDADTPRTIVLLVAACLFIASFGITYTLHSRHYLSNAGMESGVSSVLRFKMDSIMHIARVADTQTYAIMQDGRSPETGVDYWVPYIHYWVTSQDRVPTGPSAPEVFVIKDGKSILRPEVGYWLSGRSMQSFGTLGVFHFEGDDARQWRELVTKYPPGKKQ